MHSGALPCADPTTRRRDRPTEQHETRRLKKQLKERLTDEDLVVSVVLLVCVAGLAAYASTWPRKPALMPLGICIVVAALLSRQILHALRKGNRESQPPIPSNVIASFVAFGLTIPVAWLAGLVPATGLLGAYLSFLYGERRWWAIAATGAACSLLTYAVFGQVFSIPLTFR